MPAWKVTMEGVDYIMRGEEALFAYQAAIETWSLMSVSNIFTVNRTWAGLEFIKATFLTSSISSANADVQFSLILNPFVNGERLGKINITATLRRLNVESEEYYELLSNAWEQKLSIDWNAREVAKVQLTPLREYPTPGTVAEGLVKGIGIVLKLLREELRSKGDALDQHLKLLAPENI